ncbi:hypothetical protein [Streptomyces cavernae]|uniref:hypothetical protein n=1 Tax=Streptomyces cavernae TaxID=2259034 RepID=UPI000FEBB07B|nr:hypothetical protein [Streptomyces cavernae]
MPARRARPTDTSPTTPVLSSVELAVLEGRVNGLTYMALAARLNYAYSSTKDVGERVLRKLNPATWPTPSTSPATPASSTAAASATATTQASPPTYAAAKTPGTARHAPQENAPTGKHRRPQRVTKPHP